MLARVAVPVPKEHEDVKILLAMRNFECPFYDQVVTINFVKFRGSCDENAVGKVTIKQRVTTPYSAAPTYTTDERVVFSPHQNIIAAEIKNNVASNFIEAQSVCQ